MRGFLIASIEPHSTGKESNSRMSIESRKFRDDINGLRAWAVIAVIFYHFGVSGFTGGFVGVDIFFAISGFLMTGIVVSSLENSERSPFSILKFYMARARRILPALIALCAFLLIFGWWFLLPIDYKLLGTHSAFSISFLSNIKFWGEAGYFDTQSHEKWLLHTWSLAVEWQFYLILPLIFMTAWKVRPHRTALTLVAIAIFLASLALSIAITPLYPTAALYLLPTRAWEMLAGGLVFLLVNRNILSPRSSFLIEALGFLLIIGSIAGFDTSSSWPGWRALIPVTGTLLVIFAARTNSLWTGASWMQWIGTRSYSLYLWHWPIVVALTYYGQQFDPAFVTAGLILTVILGHLSYVFIETPSRQYLSNLSLGTSAKGLMIGSLAVVAAGYAIHFKQGIYGRFNPAVESISAESLNKNPRRDECILVTGIVSPSCTFGGNDLQAIVLGDSHAEAVTSAVVAAAPSPKSEVMEWTYSACPIIRGVQSPERQQCGAFVDWALLQLKTIPHDVPVVIMNRYAQFAFGANETSIGANIPQVYFSKPYKSTTPEFLEEYAANLTKTVCLIAQDRTVYLVRPFPEMGFNVPNAMARSALLGIKKDVQISLADYHSRQEFVWKAQNMARDQCGVKILDPLPYLCSNGHCNGAKDNRPLYRDDNHFSEYGNKILTPMFSQIFTDKHVSEPLINANTSTIK